ncbi:MAG TPA: shikimate kinase [Candidatus Limnocylindria bacterium]|jgi:shikimate kinase|nr:shikimate kinase [Candidatus Limnocylindria bacterium]
MSPPRQFRNVALVGFMGAGKSTVGYLLSELLRYELVDTDKVIEQRTGRRISDIFATDGEPAFRALEAALVKELESAKDTVISTGGGLVVNPDNLASLRQHCLVACLWASPQVIYDRVRHQSHRPLLQAPDPLAKITELLGARAPFYKQADLLVGVDFRAPLETARHIASSLRRLHPVPPPVPA